MVIFALLLSILLIIVLTTRLHIHPFLALFTAALIFGFLTGMPAQAIVASINDGFRDTIGKTGFIIVFGVIIGAFLENSGAAYVLTDKMLGLIGRRNVIHAMAFTGYFISIPVFADSGFLLVSPLNRSLSRRAGTSFMASSIALALGLILSHTMIPPTPGPVAAAGILNVDIGLVLLIGIPVSIASVMVGIFYCIRYVVPRDTAPDSGTSDDSEAKQPLTAPGPVLSALPVFIPVLLIVLKSLLPYVSYVPAFLHSTINFLGEPFIALFAGVLLSLLLPRRFDLKTLSADGWVGKALRDAAAIILITGAGGTFGKVLQNSELSAAVSDVIPALGIGIWLPFILASIIKTAQGSSTVAIITAASIISPLMGTLGFVTPVEKALVVLIIGAGSAVVCHANDSFFWVVTQLSGTPVNKGLRLFTPGTAVVGFSAAIFIFITYLVIH